MDATSEHAAAWEAEGRRLSPALDGVAAAVVAGPDVVAASHLALGLANGQAARRRVALGDLTGTAAPLLELVAAQVTDEDPHGLADVLHYGVSTNRVARQVDPDGRLFVLPAGTEPLDTEALADPRWGRIAGGFRDAGALLLLVAPTSTPQLDVLARQLDGTVAADDGATTQLMPNVLATAQRVDGMATPAASPTPGTPGTPLRPTENIRLRYSSRQRESDAAAASAAAAPRRVHPAILVVAGLLLLAGLYWAWRTFTREPAGPPTATEDRSVAAPDSLGGAPLPLSARATAPDSVSDSTAAAPPARDDGARVAALPAVAPPVANPADSVRAAAFAIELYSAAGEDAARASYGDRPRTLLATTFAPVAAPDGAISYRVAGGAYRTRALAARELGRLRAARELGADRGALVRLPYAVQIESGVPRDSLRVVMNRFVAMQLAPYAMEQPNRSSRIYVGAFAEPGEARALLSTLQGAGIPAALVVRTGKPL